MGNAHRAKAAISFKQAAAQCNALTLTRTYIGQHAHNTRYTHQTHHTTCTSFITYLHSSLSFTITVTSSELSQIASVYKQHQPLHFTTFSQQLHPKLHPHLSRCLFEVFLHANANKQPGKNRGEKEKKKKQSDDRRSNSFTQPMLSHYY